MSYEEYVAKRRQDPEYREVERRLRPILDLADDVFNLRMERGWTQAELAKRVGTRQANISRLENGLTNPTFKFLQKLGEVFETELVVRLSPPSAEVHVQIVYVPYIAGELFFGSAGSTPMQPYTEGRIITRGIEA
jgi:transcriptional regulator with XRE-family HTH domain